MQQGRRGLFSRVGSRFSKARPSGTVAVSDGRTVAVRRIRVGAIMEPASVSVPPEVPVRLVFAAGTGDGAGDTVVFPGLGRMVTLRRDGETVVEFDALATGRYAFTCGPERSGTLVVR